MSDKNCTKCKWESNCINMEGDFSKPPGECNKGDKWEPIEIEAVEEDNVNHPKHYNMFCTEVIDVIKACLTEEEFKGYLKGNMLKYRFRAGFKDNREEDLRKSNWYQDRVLGET